MVFGAWVGTLSLAEPIDKLMRGVGMMPVLEIDRLRDDKQAQSLVGDDGRVASRAAYHACIADRRPGGDAGELIAPRGKTRNPSAIGT